MTIEESSTQSPPNKWIFFKKFKLKLFFLNIYCKFKLLAYTHFLMFIKNMCMRLQMILNAVGRCQLNITIFLGQERIGLVRDNSSVCLDFWFEYSFQIDRVDTEISQRTSNSSSEIRFNWFFSNTFLFVCVSFCPVIILKSLLTHIIPKPIINILMCFLSLYKYK